MVEYQKIQTLFKRDGERLITKIKTVDFRKYQLAYPNKL